MMQRKVNSVDTLAAHNDGKMQCLLTLWEHNLIPIPNNVSKRQCLMNIMISVLNFEVDQASDLLAEYEVQ